MVVLLIFSSLPFASKITCLLPAVMKGEGRGDEVR